MYLVSVYLVSVGGDANTKFRSVFRLATTKIDRFTTGTVYISMVVVMVVVFDGVSVGLGCNLLL